MEIVIEDSLEEVLDILEQNGFIIDEEIDKIFIRKDVVIGAKKNG